MTRSTGPPGDRAEEPSASGPGVARQCHPIDLEQPASAVRAGRQFVERQLISLQLPTELVHDASLVAAELLTNAVQHASPPVEVCVCLDTEGEQVRVEVRDGDSRPPVRPAPSTTNMTGRGMALIDAIASRWGVEPARVGKVVWAELGGAPALDQAPELDVDALLAAWQEEEDNPAARRYTVVLGDVPTNLLMDAKAHIDNLVREFSLAGAGDDDVPDHLAQLIETVVHGFADARDAIKRQALAASRRGEVRTNLTLHLPLTAAEAGVAYLAALDEADAYARAARLLTLETPPAHRLFRRWYVEAVVRQLRDLAAHRRPTPPRPFEGVLLEEVQRLAALQRLSERAARLQRVTAALARARTPQDVAAVVVSEGVNALDASGGGLLVPASDGEHVAVPGAVGYGEELVGALHEERLDAPLPAATAIRTGEPVWLESRNERDRQFPALRGFEGSTVSMCAVPLIVGARILGALRFSFTSRRLFDEDERAFVLALAAQTAQTLQRTELYAAERQASLELQRALLPQDAPAPPGWDIATYYRPAGAQQAGGDFYDVLPLSDGRFVAVVGDVMGRGVQAAAAMAQIRTTIRAYAIDDPDPAVLFAKIDAVFAALPSEQLVTVVYLLIEQSTGRVEVANAGHLPPLLVAAAPQLMALPAGTPFGVDAAPGRQPVTVRLRAGEALVAFTDGLVERRHEDIDEGIGRLTGHLATAPADTAAGLLQQVIGSQPNASHDDDVTVLVLRRDGEEMLGSQ